MDGYDVETGAFCAYKNTPSKTAATLRTAAWICLSYALNDRADEGRHASVSEYESVDDSDDFCSSYFVS